MKLTRERLKQIIKEELQEIRYGDRYYSGRREYDPGEWQGPRNKPADSIKISSEQDDMEVIKKIRDRSSRLPEDYKDQAIKLGTIMFFHSSKEALDISKLDDLLELLKLSDSEKELVKSKLEKKKIITK